MKKKRHIWLWILGGFVLLITAVVLLLESASALVSTRWAKDKINQILSSVVDGEFDYAGLDMSFARNFPACRVVLDTVCLTYDHEKFSKWDSLGDRHALLSRGRGAERDTLARFDRLMVSLNCWKLIGGTVRIKEIRLEGVDAFLHFYDSTASNLNIFIPSGKEKDTTKVFSFPTISVGELYIPDLEAVYTDQSKSLYASASLDALTVSGHFKLDANGTGKFRGVNVRIDSLFAKARAPRDSAVASIPSLSLSEPYKNVFDLDLDLLASAKTRRWGKLVVPANLDGSVSLNWKDNMTKIVVPRLDGRVAHIPLHIDGNATIRDKSTAVSMSASITDCPLDTLLSEYGVKFIKATREIRTDAHIDIDATAEGEFTKRLIPEITASIKLPKSHIAYTPLEIDGSLALDANAAFSPQKILNVSINELKAIVPGVALSLEGSGDDVLSGNPDMRLAAEAAVEAGPVSEILPPKLGIVADGNAQVSIFAKGKPMDLIALNFGESSLDVTLDADRLAMRIPKDTLSAVMHRPSLKFVFGQENGDIRIFSDSLSFSKGEGLAVRAKMMKNYGTLSNVEYSGKIQPHISLIHSDEGVSLRTGNNWFFARDLDLATSATKRERLSDEMWAKIQEHIVRDSIERSRKSYWQEKDFEKNDIKISLDTTLLRYMRQWNPIANVSIGRGMAKMPVLPLRTRISGLKATFDGDVLSVDTLSVKMGSSDATMKGRASGLRRFLRGKGTVDARVGLDSRRVNMNELLAAFSAGKEIADSSFSETDDSFVVDTLDNVVIEDASSVGIPLVIIPGNVSATVDLAVDTVDFKDFKIHPLLAQLNMRERTVQMLDTRVFTNLGDIMLSGFYSARNKKEISSGVDIGVYNVSADSLIRLLPKVDSLMPVLKSFKGRLNCEVTAMAPMDTNMQFLIPQTEGVIRIKGKNLKVEDAGSLRKITRLLRFKNPNIGQIEDLTLNAVIHDNKLDIFPFTLGVDRYRLALHGMQRFDDTMYYHASVIKSPFIVRFGVNLFGTFKNWGFTMGFPKYTNSNVPDFKPQIDTMQNIITGMIRNVFEEDNAELLYSEVSGRFADKTRELSEEAESLLSTDEAQELSELTAFEYDAMIQEEQLQKEVDKILEDSFRDITNMMRDYEDRIYDKKIFRKIARLKDKIKKKK